MATIVSQLVTYLSQERSAPGPLGPASFPPDTPSSQDTAVLTLPATGPRSKMERDFRRVVITLDNILIPDEKLGMTPSQLDGLSESVETDLKVLGTELIQTAGILLDLPQVAMATGQVLFQRFYYCKSFVKHSMEVVAMSCIHLASKIEEAPRRIRDVIAVFHHTKRVRYQKTISPLVLDQNYINLKNHVIKEERRILKELGFCVHVKHPHKMIVMYLQLLEAERNRRLVQCAWNYMNDSFRSNVFVRFTPETIACSCIYLAARQLQIVLPNNPPWFALFGVLESDIKQICLSILSLYTRSKPNFDELEKTVNELKKLHAKQKAKSHAGAASSTPPISSTPGTPSEKQRRDSPVRSTTNNSTSRDYSKNSADRGSNNKRPHDDFLGRKTSGDSGRRSKGDVPSKKYRSDEDDKYDVSSLKKEVKSSEKHRLKRSHSRSPAVSRRGGGTTGGYKDVKRSRADDQRSKEQITIKSSRSSSRSDVSPPPVKNPPARAVSDKHQSRQYRQELHHAKSAEDRTRPVSDDRYLVDSKSAVHSGSSKADSGRAYSKGELKHSSSSKTDSKQGSYKSDVYVSVKTEKYSKTDSSSYSKKHDVVLSKTEKVYSRSETKQATYNNDHKVSSRASIIVDDHGRRDAKDDRKLKKHHLNGSGSKV